MPTGFHPNPHFFSAHLELAVELLRFLAVPQFPFVQFPRVRIDKRNLLEARVIVTTYNDHVRLLSPEPWLVSATKVYSGMGADIVMESLHSLTGVVSVIAMVTVDTYFLKARRLTASSILLVPPKIPPQPRRLPSAKKAVERVSPSPYSTLTQLFTKSLPCFPYETLRTFVITKDSFLP